MVIYYPPTQCQAVYRVTRMQRFRLDDEAYSSISSKGNITHSHIHQSSHERNSSMPPIHVVEAIQISEPERMDNNIFYLDASNTASIDRHSLSDKEIHDLVGIVNQAFFQRQQDMELSDQFVCMIQRQKWLFIRTIKIQHVKTYESYDYMCLFYGDITLHPIQLNWTSTGSNESVS